MLAIAMATIVNTPILSSDHASERVRGITPQLTADSQELSAQKLLNVRILRIAQRVGVAFEDDEAVAQHDEFCLALLLRCRRHDMHRAVAIASRHVRRDIERVAE